LWKTCQFSRDRAKASGRRRRRRSATAAATCSWSRGLPSAAPMAPCSAASSSTRGTDLIRPRSRHARWSADCTFCSRELSKVNMWQNAVNLDPKNVRRGIGKSQGKTINCWHICLHDASPYIERSDSDEGVIVGELSRLGNGAGGSITSGTSSSLTRANSLVGKKSCGLASKR
jgi:hypothetical protein